jgi:hypothetical protein
VLEPKQRLGVSISRGVDTTAKSKDQRVPIVVSVVNDPHWQRSLEQIGPMSAGLAIQATTNLGSLPLSP